MPRLSVRLSDTALHQVEALAAARGGTVSDAIRSAIEQASRIGRDATAPQTLDTCARHVLHYMTTHVNGLEETVVTMASACHRPVQDMMSYMMYTGMCALAAGFAPMGDDAPQAR
jgi:hypothetical protein